MSELRLPVVVLAFALAAACEDGVPRSRAVDLAGEPGVVLGPVSIRVDTAWMVGALTAPDRLVFGEISDAAFGHSPGVFVLDGRRNRVAHLDSRGQVVRFGGSPGRGPGELAEPTELHSRSDGTLLVVDPRGGKIEYFDGDLVGNGRLPMRQPVLSACVLDSLLVVHSPTDSSLIRIVDDAGTRVREFGRPFDDESRLLSQSLSRAMLLCLPDRHEVAVLFSRRPELRLYAADGRLRWARTIPQFTPMAVAVNSDGSTSFGTGPSGWHHLPIGFERFERDQLLVQIGRIDEDNRTRETTTEIETFLVTLADGEFRPVWTALPRLVGSSDTLLVAAVANPVPRVLLLRRKDRIR